MNFPSLFSGFQFSDSLTTFMIEVGLKSALIAFAGCLAIWLMRRSSASFRHLMCVTAILALLLVPIGVVSLPSFNVLPKITNQDVASKDNSAPRNSGSPSANPAGTSGLTAQFDEQNFHVHQGLTPQKTSSLESRGIALPGWGTVLAAIWLTGTTVLLTKLIFNIVSLYFHLAQCRLCENRRIVQRVQEKSKSCGSPTPTIFINDQIQVPMVWGILKARMVLPSSAFHWSDMKLNGAIDHELAHLLRRDPLTLTLGQLAHALYWFNPLVGILNRQMVLEQEKACDNHVINNCADKPGYAAILLDMAAAPQKQFRKQGLFVSMAKQLRIERRIQAILSTSENRTRVKPKLAVLLLLCAVCGTGTLASLSAQQPNTTKATNRQESETLQVGFTENESIIKAVKFLESTQKEDGTFPALDGATALATMALQHASDVADPERLARAIKATAESEPKGTYSISLTLIVLCQANDETHQEKIEDLIAKLCSTQCKQSGIAAGGWTYEANNRADGSNTRFAVWALTVAQASGHEVPEDTLSLAVDYWLTNKLDRGGWSYVGPQTPRSVTMTMSGIACLSWLQATLAKDDERHAKIDSAIVDAWAIENLDEQIKSHKNWPWYAVQIYSAASQATSRDLDGLPLESIPTGDQIHTHIEARQEANGQLGGNNMEAISTSLAILAARKQ
jgi:beta-lactamase regulating signal transducer with metallopeptidase domain